MIFWNCVKTDLNCLATRNFGNILVRLFSSSLILIKILFLSFRFHFISIRILYLVSDVFEKFQSIWTLFISAKKFFHFYIQAFRFLTSRENWWYIKCWNNLSIIRKYNFNLSITTLTKYRLKWRKFETFNIFLINMFICCSFSKFFQYQKTLWNCNRTKCMDVLNKRHSSNTVR